ncbi:MAG: hypothetical protein ACRDFY_03440 [Candidatus Limnocylindria bacterium]
MEPADALDPVDPEESLPPPLVGALGSLGALDSLDPLVGVAAPSVFAAALAGASDVEPEADGRESVL